MAAAARKQEGAAYQSCVAGRCTLTVRRLTDDGGTRYLCGPVRDREHPAAPCKIYYLDGFRPLPARPRRPRGLRRVLAGFFRL